MPPNDYIEARKRALNGEQRSFSIDGRPYLPHIIAISSDLSSITNAVRFILELGQIEFPLTATLITGGITNILYKVSGLIKYTNSFDSVLVRLFGAEGMIDRDIENFVFASLSQKGIAPAYYGRFSNGRVEGFLENYTTFRVVDFQDDKNSDAIAEELAKLHFGFSVPKEYFQSHEPELWRQLFSWIDQALQIKNYKSVEDHERAKRYLHLSHVPDELHWLKNEIAKLNALVVFCHNDLLAANVMKHSETGKIQLIDFEYGGTNYAAYDIANHFNEHAGGTTPEDNGVPNYNLVPSRDRQVRFLSKYIAMARSLSSDLDDRDANSFLLEVQLFMLANNLYWGLWAVIQASVEGTNTFDYLGYAIHRLKRYDESKKTI